MPDALVNNILATQFVGFCERLEGVEDLGWLGASHFALPSFSNEVTDGLRSRSSLSGKMELFRALSALEDSHLDVRVVEYGKRADLVCDMLLPTELVGMSCSEWVQLAVLIEIVRSVIGPTWTPHALNFRTAFKPAREAQAAFPDSRFRFGQARTSITIDSDLLECCSFEIAGDKNGLSAPENFCQIETLKQLIRPYLLTAPPPIDLLADMVDSSARSFQRWLLANGTSYRKLVNETRGEMAKEMLADEDMSLIQVAMYLGYENQSNFGRSFKKTTGVSPAMYRKGINKTKTYQGLMPA
nr:AraC family transcriptional regulator [Shimia abyssi]